LHELEEDATKKKVLPRPFIGPHPAGNKQLHAHDMLPSIPVSMGPLRAILINLDTQARAMDNGGLSKETILLAENDSYNVWRLYSAPLPPVDVRSLHSRSASDRTIYATQENLLRANRAAESLLNGLVFFSQQHAGEIGDVVAGRANNLDNLIRRQEPLSRCFNEVSTALRLFRSEMETAALPPPRKAPTNLFKLLLTLTLFHTTARLLLYHDPEIPDPAVRAQGLPAHFDSIVDICERVLTGASASTAFTPSPSTTQPLSLVALAGFPNRTRRRALDLLRNFPRREGLWHTDFASSLVAAVMARERTLLQQASELTSADVSVQTGSDRVLEAEDDKIVPTLLQMYSIRVSFEGQRRAVANMTTWGEWLSGKQGKRIELSW
jgi:hypothetical protein